MGRIRGYHYTIVEMFPNADNEVVVQKILMYDNLESAQEVLDAMNRNNFNFSCYYILMEPIYERRPTISEILAGPDWERVDGRFDGSIDELPDPPF